MFGGIVTFVIYGAIMNPVSALIYGAEMNWQTLLTYYITGFPMDCVHACATVIFLLLLAEPCWKSWTASRSNTGWWSDPAAYGYTQKGRRIRNGCAGLSVASRRIPMKSM